MEAGTSPRPGKSRPTISAYRLDDDGRRVGVAEPTAYAPGTGSFPTVPSRVPRAAAHAAWPATDHALGGGSRRRPVDGAHLRGTPTRKPVDQSAEVFTGAGLHTAYTWGVYAVCIVLGMSIGLTLLGLLESGPVTQVDPPALPRRHRDTRLGLDHVQRP